MSWYAIHALPLYNLAAPRIHALPLQSGRFSALPPPGCCPSHAPAVDAEDAAEVLLQLVCVVVQVPVLPVSVSISPPQSALPCDFVSRLDSSCHSVPLSQAASPCAVCRGHARAFEQVGKVGCAVRLCLASIVAGHHQLGGSIFMLDQKGVEP